MAAGRTEPPPPPEVAATLLQQGCGRTIGRYTLLRRIAKGGMAEVYLARSDGASGVSKQVALKRILPQHAHNERFVAMLVDEAKIAVTLAHPNIAQVFEFGLEAEDFFLVMEHVPGPSLADLLRRIDARAPPGRTLGLPIRHAVHVVAEVARGLEHAHTRTDVRGRPLGIVHRDVSPQNVLVSYGGDVKLIDFGIARARNRLAETQAGVIKGKLRYLAPEIAAGEEPDHRADVYCCGIVLFELLTGEALYAPASDFEAIEMATRGVVRSPRASNPAVPAELDALVRRTLSRDRAGRPPTARALQDDLRRFLNHFDPGFVESQFGEFVSELFAAERARDRALDVAAEMLSRRSTEEATEFGPSPYRSIVAAEAPAPRPEAEPVEAQPPRTRAARWWWGAPVAAGALAYALARPAPPPDPVPEAEAEASPMLGTLELSISPPVPVRVELDGAVLADGATPPLLLRAAPGLVHRLEISADGYEPHESRAEVGAGRTTRIELTLEPKAPPPTTTAPVPSPRGPTSPPPAQERPRRRFGHLLVNSRPASVVWIGGRKLGETPVRTRLPAGRHRVTLEGPGGAKKVVIVQIRAGHEDQFTYRWP